MPAPLRTIGISGLGFKGLNSQKTHLEDPSWATIANNCVIDSKGRLAARKGWTTVNTTQITGAPTVKALYEFKKVNGETEVISAAAGGLYTGTTTLTSIVGSLTHTTADWKFQNFNGRVVGFQDNHTPISYNGTGNFDTITFTYPSSGTNSFGGEVLAAFGRLWATDSSKTVLKYSDLLVYNSWTDDAGANGDGSGSAGVVDLKSVYGWSNGMDFVQAISEFNGFLLVFGKKSILVFSGASDPSTMAIVDIINGIGCAARDSVQNIGSDILFLSDSGVRSFRRTIQEKSMPITEVSANVRDDMKKYISGEPTAGIKSAYHELEGFYLISFPVSGKTYVFDVRGQIGDGTFRVTTWNKINPTAFLVHSDDTLYIGKAGYIGKYDKYKDNGSSYPFSYYSMWINFGVDQLKIPKKVSAVINGGQRYVVSFKLGFDYSKTYKTLTYTIPSNSDASEYNESEYGIAEYGNALGDTDINIPAKGNGNVLQIGIETTINGTPFAIEKYELYFKLGRID